MLLALLVAGAAGAHTRSTSYSSWEIEGREARVRFRIPQLELTRLPWGIVAPPHFAAELGRYLTDGLSLEAGGVPCQIVDGPRALAAPSDRALLEWRVRCPAAGALAIESDLMREVAPSHLHFARLREPDGGIVERVLAGAERSWPLPDQAAHAGDAAPSAGSSVLRYVDPARATSLNPCPSSGYSMNWQSVTGPAAGLLKVERLTLLCAPSSFRARWREFSMLKASAVP